MSRNVFLSDFHIPDGIMGLFNGCDFHILCRVWQEQLINDLDLFIRYSDRC